MAKTAIAILTKVNVRETRLAVINDNLEGVIFSKLRLGQTFLWKGEKYRKIGFSQGSRVVGAIPRIVDIADGTFVPFA